MLYIVIGECWFCWKSLNPFPGPINPDSHPSHFCFFLVCWEWAFSPPHTFNDTFILSTQYCSVSTIYQEWRVVIWFLTLLDIRITLSSLLRNAISPRDSDSLVRSPGMCIFKLVCQPRGRVQDSVWWLHPQECGPPCCHIFLLGGNQPNSKRF